MGFPGKGPDRPSGRVPPFPDWGPVGCTRHQVKVRCPGELLATGPERHGFKVVVETPHSMEAYGVLVAPAGKVWRARILTYPGSLWTVPGGGRVLKFVASTPQRAEEQAIRFIEQHCVARGYLLRNGLELADPRRARSRPGVHPPPQATTTVEPRWPKVFPVRYEVEGLDPPALEAVTRNVSASGLFIQTPAPVVAGRDVLLHLKLAAERLLLKGTVVWLRQDSEVGRPPGMGLRLVMPPDAYLNYIRSLPPPAPGEGF